jgi:hypothetical protein
MQYVITQGFKSGLLLLRTQCPRGILPIGAPFTKPRKHLAGSSKWLGWVEIDNTNGRRSFDEITYNLKHSMPFFAQILKYFKRNQWNIIPYFFSLKLCSRAKRPLGIPTTSFSENVIFLKLLKTWPCSRSMRESLGLTVSEPTQDFKD